MRTSEQAALLRKVEERVQRMSQIMARFEAMAPNDPMYAHRQSQALGGLSWHIKELQGDLDVGGLAKVSAPDPSTSGQKAPV